jgi:hypothetical protein
VNASRLAGRRVGSEVPDRPDRTGAVLFGGRLVACHGTGRRPDCTVYAQWVAVPGRLGPVVDSIARLA